MTEAPSVRELGAPAIVIMAIASALTVANVYFN